MYLFHRSSNPRFHISQQRGAIALFMVLVIAAGTMILASNAAFLSLGELESSNTMQKGWEALAIADGCVNKVLEQLRYNNSYGVGGGTLAMDILDGDCSFTVTNDGGSVRTITATGTLDEYNKKVVVTATAAGTVVTITNWQESDS